MLFAAFLSIVLPGERQLMPAKLMVIAQTLEPQQLTCAALTQ